MKARVFITLKKGVLDPQGKAILGALRSLGFDEVRDVRTGKLIELELEGSSRDEAEKRIEGMCERLLSNPVVEDYRIEVD